MLTHPAFERPPVHNDRRPGPKKGTHSLAKARRERDAANVRFLLAAGPLDERFDEGDALADKRIRGAKTLPPGDDNPMRAPLVKEALDFLAGQVRRRGGVMDRPGAVRDYLRLHLAWREDREVFAAMFVDTRHALIAFEIVAVGTLNEAAIYPRELVRRALAHNAAGVILAHNHPSGDAEPSIQDGTLTRALQLALRTVDVHVLDHVIVGRGGELVSFAARGLL